jgi:hypothetical protein
VLQTKAELVWPDANNTTDVTVLSVLVLDEGSGRLLKQWTDNTVVALGSGLGLPPEMRTQ